MRQNWQPQKGRTPRSDSPASDGAEREQRTHLNLARWDTASRTTARPYSLNVLNGEVVNTVIGKAFRKQLNPLILCQRRCT
jgi:hypothetical protein